MTNIFNEAEIEARKITKDAISIKEIVFENSNKLYVATLGVTSNHRDKNNIIYYQATEDTEIKARTEVIKMIKHDLDKLCN